MAVAAKSDLFAQVLESPSVQALARRLEQGGVLSLTGVSPAAQPFLAAVLHQLLPARPIVVVTQGLKVQESFHQDVTSWLRWKSSPNGSKSKTSSDSKSPGSENSSSTPLFYPAWEILPHEDRLPHADVISERLETLVALSRLQNKDAPSRILVTNVIALLQRTFVPGDIQKRTRELNVRDVIEPLDLVEWLEDQGYEPEAQVTQKGEISLRGGILDLFPLTSPWPIRIEFFGDDVESLRYFDPLTQISREEIKSLKIPPAGELGILRRQLSHSKERAGEGSESAVQGRENNSVTLKSEAAALGTLLDYLPQGTIFLICEPETVAERASEYQQQVRDGDPFFISWDEFVESSPKQGMTLLSVAEASLEIGDPTQELDASSNELVLQLESLDAFRPVNERPVEPMIAEAQRREFFQQIHRWLRQGYSVRIFCNNDGELQRFSEVWEEYGLGKIPTSNHQNSIAETRTSKNVDESAFPEVQLAALARGFLFEEAKAVVITDAEIFGRYKVQRPRRLKSPHAQATRSALDIDFSELEDGDFVVHLQHGIGRYLGLHVLPIGSGTKSISNARMAAQEGQECLVIEYAPNDPTQPNPRLYVPVTEAHLVSKYVGTGKARPPLNSLGGTRWAKAKAHAETAVRDVASDLLAIQAARDSQEGFAFSPDVPWQREFEGAFVFEETPDQIRAIAETKSDMERPKPMDRLICGDVGFGKTEVGIRAAFKAVMNGRQVAVLVPTTVLAQQHFNTFRERMADYPIRIELLSRFRTRREQQRVVADLAAGSVDIVIGTHRLVQSDISFKELGLVIIDEEQRFGVLHKEKFKMLRKLVDVLTLSATPIPRTLYLALTGARDMSTIQTPPHDRLPVETIVTAYDERVIRDAIQREINRGGQIFFLHNRVSTIDVMAQKLQSLVPNARMVVGHGQMESDQLEEVMTKFINGEADVLLSTTIIESGLDIPNANTIIIDRADRFGLSDLYQLRGRVGRYKHQAYAYLLLPRHGNLVADVRKRITAIKQYSTLGSGFKIAMRDLEIRGAGNLLGSEQSGHITAVGFDLYCQLLKQSVASLKGEQVKPRVEVQVRMDFVSIGAGEFTSVSGASSDKKSVNRSAAKSSESPVSEDASQSEREVPAKSVKKDIPSSAAYIPFKYISDSRQRIEIYRKLAQATDPAAVRELEKEMRDRFGEIPAPLQLLLQLAGLRILAGDKGITAIEVKEDRVMLTRNNDFVMVGNKFPRLTKTVPSARLTEIKKLLLAL